MAWVGSLPLLLGERLLVNLVMTHSSCIPKAMFLTSMVSATARTLFGISKTGFESVAEGTASKPMRRMNERPKKTQKVQKGMDSDSKEVSYTCQKPPNSDSFFCQLTGKTRAKRRASCVNAFEDRAEQRLVFSHESLSEPLCLSLSLKRPDWIVYS
ncbi:hypothetical protein BD560DRAFT_494485 [Blakeslea trispora]|nr:hypothetical protein BD560DRAFT_494485 [Blakeslea trispora]